MSININRTDMDPITIGLGVAGLASSLYGGYKAGQERKKMKGELGAMEAENKAIYNTQALGDYTQRADSQNVLRQMRNQRALFAAVADPQHALHRLLGLSCSRYRRRL